MNQILKSSIDTRDYKVVKLSNELVCLLISDPETDKSGAAMSVNVGSFEDPAERQGLAHFCEHMLFMGTTKFPDEGEYNDYISKNSGQTNAFTDSMITCYMFDIANNAFQGAIDRFSQFFIAPKFDPSCTDREMNAVNSEYNLNIQQDVWRKFQLERSLSKKGNSYNKFSIGNLSTLQFPDTRNFLLEFHEKYYSSNQMKLVLYGQQSIQQLEEWANQYFLEIKNKQLQAPVYNELPYDEKTLNQLVTYASVREEAYLELQWLVDNMLPLYTSSPGHYISHLLGHEGENSLLSFLIDEGLAQELSAGSQNEMKLFTYITVSIKLTKKGEANIDKILSYIFTYIKMLKQKGVQKWIFDEIKVVRELQFAFLEKQKPFGYMSSIGEKLHNYPIEHVLKAHYMMEEFTEDIFKKFIDSLTEKNVMIFLSSKEFTGKLPLKEQYFGTEYSNEPIPESFLNAMINTPAVPEKTKKKLDLPIQNTFLPKSTELYPLPENCPTVPQKILENEQVDLWYKRDHRFKVPKAVVFLRIICQDMGIGTSVSSEILLRIWVLLLKDAMREFNYLADMAYIESSMANAVNGIQVTITGFNDSILTFAREYFKRIKNFNAEEQSDFFENARKRIQDNLENFFRQQPYNQVYNYNEIITKEGGSFDPSILVEHVKIVTFQDFVYFGKKFLNRLRFTGLIIGNMLEEDAKTIALDAQNIFAAKVLPKDEILQIRTIDLSETQVTWNFSYELKEPTETNSGVLIHYQKGQKVLRTQLLNDILGNILQNPFFQQLRAVEQLGYAVFTQVSNSKITIGFSFIIQSNAKCPQYVQNRIRKFICENMYEQLKSMKLEEFEKYRESMKITLSEKDYNLIQECQRQWMEIASKDLIFDRKQQLLQILPTVTFEEVLKFYEDYFLTAPKMLEIHAIASVHKQENDELKKEVQIPTEYSSSVQYIKRRLPLYPDTLPSQ